MTGRAIIIALWPEWARAIARGEKRLEFRRVWSRQPAPYDVYLYVTSPVAVLHATVTVAAVHDACPDSIATLKERYLFPHTTSRVMDYLRGRGFALEVHGYRELSSPIPLRHLRELGFTPPQNYAYLDSFPRLATVLKNEIFEEPLAPDTPARQNEPHQLRHKGV